MLSANFLFCLFTLTCTVSNESQGIPPHRDIIHHYSNSAGVVMFIYTFIGEAYHMSLPLSALQREHITSATSFSSGTS